MAYDQDAEYEDADYPWKPHVGGRYYGNKNFRYGAQPDLFGQEFGDRSSKLFVYVPQQLNLSLAGFLGSAPFAPQPVTLARAAALASRQGAAGTMTLAQSLADGETGIVGYLQTWDSAGGSGQHTVSSITGGGSWSLHDSFTWNDGTLRRRIEWWKTAPGAAVATANVVLAFTGTAPLVEGACLWPVAGAVAMGTMARALGTSAAPSVTLTNMLDNNNLMLAILFNGDSSSPLTANVGTSDGIMNAGAASDFYARAMHNTRSTPGTLTTSVTDIASNTWWAEAIELRSEYKIKRAKQAHLNSSQGTAGLTIAQALANIAPDSLVVVMFTFANGVNVSTMRDDLAVNGAVASLFDDTGFSQNFRIYYFKDYGGGDRTFTTTLSAAAAWRDMWVVEYLGADLTAPLDGATNRQSPPNAATFDAGALVPAPSVDGTLICGVAEGGTGAPAPAAPYVDVFTEAVANHSAIDYVQPTAAVSSPTWTQTSGPYSAIGASFKPAISSGGSSFPLSGDLTKTLTPGGLSQTLSGGFTPAGALQKQINRILAGAFTPGGTIQKLVQRALAGGFTPSGALTRIINRILVGGFTPAGAVSKKVNRTLAGGSTPGGTLQKQVNRTVAGGAAPSGALVKQTQRTLAGGVAPTGTLAAARQYFKTLAGGFTPSGVLTKTAIFLRTLSGGITPAGALTKQTNRMLAGGVGPAGAVTKQTQRTVSGATAPTGALQKQVNRTLAGATQPSGVLTKITVYLRTLSGGITPAGAVTKQTNRTVSGGIAPSGAVGKRTFRNLAGSIAPTGALSKFLTKLLSGGFTPAGALTTLKAYFKTVSGTVAPTGTVQRQTAKTTQGAIAPSGAVTRRTFRTLAGQIGLSGQISRLLGKNLSGLILPTGVLTWHAIGHDFLILMAGTEGARYIIGALNAIRYRLENKSESRYGPTHTGEASDDPDSTSSSKDDL